ncbi:hypothetical protein AJ80_07152 [Polytolypa hystricis UAMH7299]|uniref:Carboxylesterase type B domain-containing protein n=1 Tax=Polytolypa hystricis (strain UAMH7299) TaxID=1447883 RepID=A0A2B7XRH7_POLH7|nr:hypothetical protein AJ80_07152 [Polytolypa hystricis UAMH7299]
MVESSLDSIGLFDELKTSRGEIHFCVQYLPAQLYGWTSSPNEGDMDANASLHDSIAALEWTKKYISRFGGDPSRIPAFGQSAGPLLSRSCSPVMEPSCLDVMLLLTVNMWMTRPSPPRIAPILAGLRTLPTSTLALANNHLIAETSRSSSGKCFPGASNATAKRVQDLFPVGEGEPPEKLAWDWVTSMPFACNSWSIAKDYSKLGVRRRYVLSVPPATHGMDICFISRPPRDLPEWPLYGTGANTLDIQEHGFKIKQDPWDDKGICDVLMDVIIDEENGA